MLICCWGPAPDLTFPGVTVLRAPGGLADPASILAWAFGQAAELTSGNAAEPVLMFGAERWTENAHTRLQQALHAHPDLHVVSAFDPGLEWLDPIARAVPWDLADLDRMIAVMTSGATIRSNWVSGRLSLWRKMPNGMIWEGEYGRLKQAALVAPVLAYGELVDRPCKVPSVLDPLRASIAAQSEQNAKPLARLTPDDAVPTVLHVVHSWGGGVAQWSRDFVAALDDRQHLFLAAHGDAQGADCGRELVLHAGDPAGPVIARWQLPVSIAAIAVSDIDYRRVLHHVIERYRIAQLVVSSPIGHALDALDVGLPTLVALHDYVPAWPLLEVRFEGDNRPFDGDRLLIDREQANDKIRLGAIDEPSWRRLKDRWIEQLRASHIRVCAPSTSVVRNLQQIDKRFGDLDISVVPLASSPIVSGPFYRPPKRRPKRWRLVVPGRINHPKGKQLLLQSLDALCPLAEIYLLGTGEDGHAFFGRSGVHVVIDYERDDLPRLLRSIDPHFALLTSTVSETFGYTLSEMWECGIPVFASRVGAFAERIEDGINGVLFPPEPKALVAAVNGASPALLARYAEAIGKARLPTSTEMAAAYRRLFPSVEPKERTARPTDLAVLESASLGFELRKLRATRKALEETVVGQRKELGARASWAYDLQRQLDRRTEWALSLETDMAKARADLDASQNELEERTRWAEDLGRELDRVRDVAAATQAELQATSQRLNTRIVELSDEIGRLVEHGASLERELADSRAARAALGRDLEELSEKYRQVIESRSWWLTKPLRFAARTARRIKQNIGRRSSRWSMLAGRTRNSLRVRGVSGTIGRIGQELKPRPEPRQITTEVRIDSSFDALSFPRHAQPTVSVVIPVYNHYQHTYTCLRSLLEASCDIAFEVVVVDDQSSDQTAEELARHQGIVVLRNPENLGFVGTCNNGAAAATGQFVVFLNNDTAVADRWLDILIGTFEKRPDAGLVGAKLVYPDGRLQEAGGIVFSDASGWNYGRFEDPSHPSFNYVREVDYCSGAAICIRRDFFAELGSFDARYAPAYYEDTDLAFAVRAAGRKVYFQPRAVVTHFEGVTAGTDTEGSGVKRYQVVNQEKFREKWQAELARQRPPDGELMRAREHGHPRRALIIDACTPEPDKDSGSVRMVNLMRILRSEGYQVTFFADNRAYVERYTDDLQDLGVEVFYHPWLDESDAFFRDHGASLDVVIASRHYIASQYTQRLKRFCPNARLLFDTVDLHYLREERLAELEGTEELVRAARKTREAELGVARAFDVTLVVSPHEKEVLAETAPDLTVGVVSNIHEIAGRRCGFHDRRGIMFVGGYQHPPNIDAVQWFARDIFPLVREHLPDVIFHIIGSKAPKEVRRLGQLENVSYEGFVPSMEPWLDGSRVAVAPLRYGAGVKGKVNSSMSYGQPVVATPPAVEGMFAEHGVDVLVAEDEENFAAEVVRVYQNEALWNTLSDGGLANVERHFSFAAARDALTSIING